MKKTLATLAAFAVLATLTLAIDNIALPVGGAFYDGKTLMPRTDDLTTTTNTDTTLFTPRFINDFLRGWVTGSNSLWMAKGLTTSDWFLVTTGSPISSSDIAADAVTSPKVLDGTLANADISTTAAIASSKLATNDTRQIGNLQVTGSVTIVAGALTDLSVQNADLAGSIASSKLATNDTRQIGNLEVTGGVRIVEGALTDSTVTSADIKNAEIADADLSASAAVSISKLATTGQLASGVKRTFSVLAVSVADAATLTPVPETMYVLTPTGIALDATATITLNALAPANAGTGTVFWICCSDAATGLVAIAKTGTFYSPALSITTGAVATCYNFGVTNKYYGH